MRSTTKKGPVTRAVKRINKAALIKQQALRLASQISTGALSELLAGATAVEAFLLAHPSAPVQLQDTAVQTSVLLLMARDDRQDWASLIEDAGAVLQFLGVSSACTQSPSRSSPASQPAATSPT